MIHFLLLQKCSNDRQSLRFFFIFFEALPWRLLFANVNDILYRFSIKLQLVTLCIHFSSIIERLRYLQTFEHFWEALYHFYTDLSTQMQMKITNSSVEGKRTMECDHSLMGHLHQVVWLWSLSWFRPMAFTPKPGFGIP